MSIPLENPPAAIDPDVAEWVMRMFTNVAGALEQLEAEKAELEERVEQLENPTP